MINKGLRFKQNLIVVAGPFSSGKTHTIGQIHKFFWDYNLFYDKPITDAVYIGEALDADHRYNNGMNHMHDNQRRPREHEHYPGEPNLQFSVTGDYIPHYMHTRFFHDLSRKWWDNHLWIVEWSGGANTNSPDNPASYADYSFATQVEGLRSGLYDNTWMSRVLMVIHPLVSDNGLRDELNNRRKGKRDPTQAEIESGMRSWWIPKSGMRITGHNDFLDAISTLERMGLSGKIHVIPNDGDEKYDRELHATLEKTVVPLLRKEGWPYGPEGNHPASTQLRDRR